MIPKDTRSKGGLRGVYGYRPHARYAEPGTLFKCPMEREAIV
jgi:hypothetical protein